MRFGGVLVVGALACGACGRLGFDPTGSSLDASDGSVPDPDAVDPLDHVTTPTGWSKAVYRDFSASFTYVPIDFVDGAEMYDNLPDWLYFQDAPFSPVLGVVAGRKLIELPAGRYIEHDFGQHAPNQPNQPDAIRNAKFVDDAGGVGPRIVIASSSDGVTNGDGTYLVSPNWTVTEDREQNNTRCFTWDPSGLFAGAGMDAYLGTATGVVRRSDGANIATGDTKTLRFLGNNLLLTRFLTPTDWRLIIIGMGSPFPETEIGQDTTIRLGEGQPPASPAAWAVFDGRKVVTVDFGGIRDIIAQTSDPDFIWESAASPPPGHPLAGPTPTVYVLENNKPLGIHRVLVFSAP